MLHVKIMVKIQLLEFFICFFFKFQEVIGCGGPLKVGQLEILTSPMYPESAAEKDNTYPSNSDCMWKNTGQADTLNMLKFLDSRIEIGENNSNVTCEFDYVNITIESVGGRRYCGYKQYEEKIIGLGSLYIHFVSDDSVNFRGFKLGYSITPNHDPCEDGAEFCGPDGRCYSEDKIKPKCRCVPGVTGEHCETEIFECQSNPCKNGGRCDEGDRKNFYSCDCPEAFLGYNCETPRPRPCDSTPCFNNGRCQQKPGWTHECTCLEFFEGDDCRIETGCQNPGLEDIAEEKRYHTGTKVEFVCSEGFNMIGENVTECQGNRQWSSPMPECEEIIIPDPNEGKIFTPFVLFLTVLIGVFLGNLLLLGLWLKLRGWWMPPKSKYPLDDVEDPQTDQKVCTIDGSFVGSEIGSDDVFEAEKQEGEEKEEEEDENEEEESDDDNEEVENSDEEENE